MMETQLDGPKTLKIRFQNNLNMLTILAMQITLMMVSSLSKTVILLKLLILLTLGITIQAMNTTIMK